MGLCSKQTWDLYFGDAALHVYFLFVLEIDVIDLVLFVLFPEFVIENRVLMGQKPFF